MKEERAQMTRDREVFLKEGRMDRGFTILEVLIGISILAIGILGVAGLAGTAVKSSSYSQSLTQANNMSQERIERLQSVDYDNVQASDSTTSLTDLRRVCTQTDFTVSRPVYSCTPTTAAISLGGKSYTWGYTVTYIDLDGSGMANPGVDDIKRIDVTVSWTDQLWHSTRSVTYSTLRTNS